MRKGGFGEKSDIRTEACIHVGLQLSGSPMSSGFDEQAFNLSNSKLGHNVVLVWLSLDQLINEESGQTPSSRICFDSASPDE